MKKIILVLVMISVLLLAGCTQDSNPGLEETSSLTISVYEQRLDGTDRTFKQDLKDVKVKLNDNIGKTDEQGNVTFNLVNGDYNLSIIKDEYNEFKENIKLDNDKVKTYDLIWGESPILDPDEVKFNIQDPQDVTINITWNDATEVVDVYRILDDGDYNTAPISEDNLEAKADGILTIDLPKYFSNMDLVAGDTVEFYVNFDEGTDQLLTVDIIDNTVPAEINPMEIDFDVNNPQDLDFTITWHSATEITGIELKVDDSYWEVEDYKLLQDKSKLTISSDRILEEGVVAGDVLEMTVNFDVGDSIIIPINIIQTTKVNITGNFDILHDPAKSVVEPSSIKQTNESLTDIKVEEENNEYIVRYSKGKDISEIIKNMEKNGHKVLDTIEELRAILVSDMSNKISLQSLEYVIDVSENGMFTANADYVIPNDARYDEMWAPSPLRLPQTWRKATGSSSVRVAVIDTGIDYTHYELVDFVSEEQGYDFVNDDADAMDDHGHGTHVSGIISAKANNESGVAGVTWGVELIPVKVLSSSGSGSYWDVAQGILYASGLLEDQPIEKADVINMSLGGSSSDNLVYDAIVKSTDAGVIISCSAGNTGTSNVGYPAAYDETIAVSALSLTYDGKIELASYSSYGEEVTVAAPGTDVLSTVLNDSFAYYSGTSMASPQVAGIIALMIDEGIPTSQILDTIKNTAIDLGNDGKDISFGYGMPNVYWAIHEVSTINVIARNDTEIITQKEIGIKDRSFELSDLPTGEYEIVLWIDVRSNDTLENGDYFVTTGIQDFSGGDYSFNMELTEFME